MLLQQINAADSYSLQPMFDEMKVCVCGMCVCVCVCVWHVCVCVACVCAVCMNMASYWCVAMVKPHAMHCQLASVVVSPGPFPAAHSSRLGRPYWIKQTWKPRRVLSHACNVYGCLFVLLWESNDNKTVIPGEKNGVIVRNCA